MAERITTVGVVGLGTMGAGIVEVFARAGLEVIGVETTTEFADRGSAILRGSTDRAVAKGKLDEAGQQAILDRVQIGTDLAALASAGLVVEAVPEIPGIKHELFTALDDIVAPEAILATNTSSLSVTDIAAVTRHPERVVGLHFFNPAPVMRLVEIITTLSTAPAVESSVVELAAAIGKKPVVVGDRAGFVANYLLFGYFNTAVRLYEQGYVSREDLDTAMRVGAGLPMGPLTLMDLVGLDVCHHIGDVIYGFSRSPQHAPSTHLEQLVTSGRLGRKSGRGFYSFAKPNSGQVVDDDRTPGPGQVDTGAVGSIGVVGSGEVAQTLVGRLRAADYEVVEVPTGSQDLQVLAQVDLVIEADASDELDETGDSAPSDDQLTGRDVDELFAELGEILKPGALLATTNTYSAVALAANSGRPEQTVVLRVHAPTGNGQAIEIGRTIATADATLAALRGVISRLGAESVVSKDRPGLVVDALLIGFLNDAVVMLDQGYAGVADIDTAITAGLGYPAGPFAIIDAIGADEVLAIAEELHSSGVTFAQPPSPLLIEHVVLDRPFTSG